jgi:hypothetical protein
LDLRAEGRNHFYIARMYDLPPEVVAKELQWYLKTYARKDSNELVAIEMEKLDSLERIVRDAMMKPSYVVSNGQIVRDVVENEFGEVVLKANGDPLTVRVEDSSALMNKVKTALNVMERRAKLLGLDAKESINVEQADTERVILTLSKEDTDI